MRLNKFITIALLTIIILSTTGCNWDEGYYNANDNNTDDNESINSTNNETDLINETINNTIDKTPEYLELELGYYDLNKLSTPDSEKESIIETIARIASRKDVYILSGIPIGSEKLYASLDDRGLETIVEGETVIAYDERSGVTSKTNFEKRTFEVEKSELRVGELYTSVNEELTIAIADSDKRYASQALEAYEDYAKSELEGNYVIVGTTYSDCYYYNGGTFEGESFKWYPERKNEDGHEQKDTLMSRDVCAYNTFITRFDEEYSVVASDVDDDYLKFDEASDITSFKPISITIKIFEKEEKK